MRLRQCEAHWTIHDRIATQSAKTTAAGLRDNLRAAAAQTGWGCTRPPAVRDPAGDPALPRLASPDEAGAFISQVMFRLWFGAPARDGFAQEGCYYINEDLPFLSQRPDPDPQKEDHEQLHLGAFVAGMIKGVLDSAGFLCDTSAMYRQPPMPGGASTQFAIHWAGSVMRRTAPAKKT